MFIKTGAFPFLSYTHIYHVLSHTHASLSQTSRALFKHRTTQLIIASSSLSHSWPSVKSHFLLSKCPPPLPSLLPPFVSCSLTLRRSWLHFYFLQNHLQLRFLLWLAVQLTSECANRLTDLLSLWPARQSSKLLTDRWTVWRQSNWLVGTAQSSDLSDRLYCKSGGSSHVS